MSLISFTGCRRGAEISAPASPILEYYSFDFIPRHVDPDETNKVWVTVVAFRPKDLTQSGPSAPELRIRCNSPDEMLNAIAQYHWQLVSANGNHYVVSRPSQKEYKFSILIDEIDR